LIIILQGEIQCKVDVYSPAVDVPIWVQLLQITK